MADSRYGGTPGGQQGASPLGRQQYLQSSIVGGQWLAGGLLPGLLLSFDYIFWRHDPRPLIITSRYLPLYGSNTGENLIAGFNLHYLSLGTIRMLIRGFTLDAVNTIRAALRSSPTKLVYRSYKVKGIKTARRIDWKAFVQRISIVRNLRPDEREALIASVEMQLARSPRDMESINRLVSEFIQARAQPIPQTMAQPSTAMMAPPSPPEIAG